MAIFNFPIVVAEEGKIFVFGSWIFTSDGQGGYRNHLANEEKVASDQPNAPNSITNPIEKSEILNLSKGSPLDGKKNNQAKSFFRSRKNDN